MYQLKITRPDSLLSVVADEPVTQAQANIVLAILKAPDLTYGEALAFLAGRRIGTIAIDYSDWPEGEARADRGNQ